jgi:uncharacterized lipoprotein YmbA
MRTRMTVFSSMQGPGNRAASIAAVMLAGALTACGSIFPDSPASRLYTIDVVAPLQSVRCPVSFSIRDLRLAGHLDREEVVLSRDGPEIRATPNDLWASPLKVEVPKVLTRLLLVRWEGSRAVQYPWRYNEVPLIALSLDVDRLEPNGDQLQAAIRWNAFDPAARSRQLDSGVFETSVPIADRSTSTSVQAINQALGRFADQLTTRARGDTDLGAVCSGRTLQPLDPKR